MRNCILLVVFSFLGFISCESGNGPSNHPPEIISMTATPVTISDGQRTQISVVATDADQDALSYTFYAEVGTFSDQVFNLIKWLPKKDSLGTNSVNCIVSDGIDTASDSVLIQVYLYIRN